MDLVACLRLVLRVVPKKRVIEARIAFEGGPGFFVYNQAL
jgi:hypothetical protein